MKTIAKILILISFLCIADAIEGYASAPATEGDSFAVEHFTLNEGAGWMFGSSDAISRSNIGEGVVGLVFSTNPTRPDYGIFQGFLYVQLYEPPLPDYQYDIREIIALTMPNGDSIPEQFWSSDRTPFFKWELKAPTLEVEGYSISFDEYPDDVIDLSEAEFQTPDYFLTDGKHIFYVVAKNTAGNFGNPGSFEIWVDGEVPDILNHFPPNNETVSTVRPQIGARLFDATSGIDQSSISFKVTDSLNYEYTGSGVYDTGSGVVVFTPDNDLAEGDVIVRMSVKDFAGNEADTLLWSFKVDTTQPAGALLINGGDPTTNSPDVVLTIYASEFGSGVTNMNISNNGIFSDDNWETYNPPSEGDPVIRNWTLDLSEGLKTVYVKFRDAAGNITPVPETASILLVLTVPNTFVTATPPSLTAQTFANFSFTSTISGSMFQYKLDNNSWSAFTSDENVYFSDLSQGNHYFQVRAGIDLDENGTIDENEVDASPAGVSWNIGEISTVPFEPAQPIRYYKRD